MVDHQEDFSSKLQCIVSKKSMCLKEFLVISVVWLKELNECFVINICER
jgi:hypothetical protein